MSSLNPTSVWLFLGVLWIAFFLPAMSRRETYATYLLPLGLLPIAYAIYLARQDRRP